MICVNRTDIFFEAFLAGSVRVVVIFTKINVVLTKEFVNKIREIEYYGSVFTRNDDKNDLFEMIINGDDVFFYYLNGTTKYNSTEKKELTFDYITNFKLLKPFNFFSEKCDLTKNYVICVAPELYKNNEEKFYTSYLFIWAKYLKFNGEKYKDDEPRVAYRIEIR